MSDISHATTAELLAELGTRKDSPSYLPAVVAAASVYGLTPDEIFAKHRREPVATARLVACFVMVEEMGMRPSHVAEIFGFDLSNIAAIRKNGRKALDKAAAIQRVIDLIQDCSPPHRAAGYLASQDRKVINAQSETPNAS